jgi:tRNA A-37 threonylcarbamoyl transferase component Bud32
MSDAGIGCLKSIVEHAGLFSTAGLGKLNEEEVAEICQCVRAAGFGAGHARSLRELCKRSRLEAEKTPLSPAKVETSPVLSEQLSPKLHVHLERKGLQRVQSVLGQSGVQSFQCLGKLSRSDFEEIVSAVRAIGPDTVTSLRELYNEARDESSQVTPGSEIATQMQTDAVQPDVLRRRPSTASPMQRDSHAAMCMVSPRRTRRSREVFEAVDSQLSKEWELPAPAAKQPKVEKAEENADSQCADPNSVPALNKVADDFVSMLQNANVQSAIAPWKPELHNALLAVQSFKQALTLTDMKQELSVKQETPSREISREAVEEADVRGRSPTESPPTKAKTSGRASVKPVGIRPKVEVKEEQEDDQHSKMFGRVNDLYCRKTRISRQEIIDVVQHTRALQTEIVKYRDRSAGSAGTLLEARIPVTVLALLRLHASCGGKEIGDQRLGRMAVDVMEENQYDPVRAVASLSPGSLLCPTTAMQVLGSGFIGVVFLEEETGHVVKVMLEDFAKREYEVFTDFANAGIAPRPLSFSGPLVTPGGGLHCIRMEAIQTTVHSVLWNKVPRGPRQGLAPPTDKVANRIGTKLAATLDCMWNKGLVHGDLHLFNIGLTDLEAQGPVTVIDFGRSSSSPGMNDPATADAFRAGHEYDVYRLVGELCGSFDELLDDYQVRKKECDKEVKELKAQPAKKTKEPSEPGYEMHQNRMLVGLQAYLADEPKSLEQVELAYSTIIGHIIKYGENRFALPYDGVPCVRSRRMRQTAMRRQKAGYAVYFKSNLFWSEEL